jgi:hypothetical protein
MWVGSSSCSVSSASTRLPDTTSFSALTAAAAFSASVRSADGSTWIHATCAGTVPTTTGSVTKRKARKKSASRLHVPEEPVSAGTTEVFTDGACRGNPGPGGWAWAVPDGAQGSGHDPATTNQRMEVRAAYEAIVALPGALVVVSDSTYLVNCFKNSWWTG